MRSDGIALILALLGGFGIGTCQGAMLGADQACTEQCGPYWVREGAKCMCLAPREGK